MIFIGLYTGNPEIDELIDKSTVATFYGVAGAGKTIMLLVIASRFCRNKECIYISTEGTLHYERVAASPEDYEWSLFTEVYDLEKLVDLATFIRLQGFQGVFVDSVNSLFRLKALNEGALSKLAYIMASLRKSVEETGGKAFMSAKVKAEEGEDTPVGESVLKYYSDLVVHLGLMGDKRYARIVKPEGSGRKYLYVITERGITWLSENT
ncbi:MAG: AAA family ATPase [Desulfurococcus sp.]|nr:AAA family ATPase [Desulfurococcus sp.]